MTAKLDILNCGAGVSFLFQCPMEWEDMAETGPRQRWCSQCESRVYWCRDLNESVLRAQQGECIAVPQWLAEGARARDSSPARDPGARVIVGRVDPYRPLRDALKERLDEDDSA